MNGGVTIMTNLPRKPVALTYEEVVESLGIKVVSPEENDNLMENIIGLEEAKKYLNQTLELYNHPNDSKNLKATMYKNIFFVGTLGSGRAVMSYAFAKALNLPIVVINSEKIVNERPTALMKGLKEVFEKHNPAVYMFKKFEYIGALPDEKSLGIYSKLRDYISTYSNCFFIACIPPETVISDIIFAKEAFNLILPFDIPTLAQREELFKKFIKDFPHDENININKIARDTVGMNAGNISTLIKSAYNQALRDNKDAIDYESIDKILSNKLYGYKKGVMTEKERKLTAYHEAGHVISGYFGNPEYKISKVEIAHRSKSLGLTVAEDDESKLTYTKSDYEKDIMLCYGGMVAERMMFGENTSGVSGDLGTATITANFMVTKFGMSDDFGPISIDQEYFTKAPLEEQAGIIIQCMLKDLFHKTELLLLEHKDALIALSDALIEKETLYSDEVLEILKQFKRN